MGLRKIKLKGIPEPIEVSENGSEIIYKGKKINFHKIKSEKHKNGFYACSVAGKSIYVHRIVAEAYVENPRPIVYKMVLHKNGDTLDNRPENLMWGDSSSLYQNRVKLGIAGAGQKTDKKYRGSSTIPYEEALKIAERLDNGEHAKDICKEYDVSEMSIARIRKRYCNQKNASPRYGKDIRETVIRLAQKHSAADVSKITGIKYHTVYRWLKNEGSIVPEKPKSSVIEITHLPPEKA